MALHIRKPNQNRMKKAENNMINTTIKKPKNEYKESKQKQPIHYSSIRTDKRLICKIKALNTLLGDKTIADTINKILKVSIPKFVKGDNKIVFKADYKTWLNKIK